MTVAYIYALVDPLTQEVRYVGKTINPKQRFISHCNQDMKGVNSYKSHWIAKLKTQGVKPEMVILEECPCDAWEDAEKRWIAHYRNIGARLTNVTDGGVYCQHLPLVAHDGQPIRPKSTAMLTSFKVTEQEYAFVSEMSDGTMRSMHGVIRKAIQALKREVEKEKKAAKKKEKGSK